MHSTVFPMPGLDRHPHESTDAIFVDPEETKAFKGKYSGIGRSLLELAERLAYFEGAEQFYVQGVNRSNLDKFYRRVGFRLAPVGTYFGLEQSIVKDLEETSFLRCGIEAKNQR